jgi:hypothetical protein
MSLLARLVYRIIAFFTGADLLSMTLPVTAAMAPTWTSRITRNADAERCNFIHSPLEKNSDYKQTLFT